MESPWQNQEMKSGFPRAPTCQLRAIRRSTLAHHSNSREGITFLGGFSGTEDSKNQRDPVLNRSILSGDLGDDDLYIPLRGYRKTGFNSTNVCTVVSAEEIPVILDGLTITRGAPDFLAEAPGAGILCTGGKIRLRHCSFETNYSYAAKGGGALSLTAGSEAFLENCIFRANSCRGDGGALYSLNSDLSLYQCEFSGNHSDDDGGAIYFRSGTLSMNRCSIVGNMCSGGGGGMLLFLAEAKISNSVFWGNREGQFSDFQSRQIIAPGNDINVEVDHCLIEQSGGSASWNPRLYNITDGGNNLDLDPVFETPSVFASGG
ncbi:right-handed parallel beta-helix repeat-containing protein [bacterium]|nr:right-handed parallel beta-helix repeat-containing protein [bacterium]MDA7934121.1 right-handed parallel beta-helix repeat-containing protein [Akkermansiaceae bacterium]